MKKILRFLPVILWVIAILSLVLGASQGFNFIQSRGSILCLSCMGLEENEDL